MPINLHDIYRKVYFRYKRAATKFVYTQVNAEFMHDAAKEILAKCTLKSVKDFESKENIYLTCPGIRSTTKPIAGEFYAAIQSKNFYVKGVQLNTHRNGKIVTDGLVYFLKSSDKPGQIKIGYTEQDIDKRINQIRRKQPFSDIVMHFYISTNKTTELEDAIQNALITARVAGRVEKNESIEWFYSDGASMVNALFTMAQLCDATVKVEWASAHYKRLLATKFSNA